MNKDNPEETKKENIFLCDKINSENLFELGLSGLKENNFHIPVKENLEEIFKNELKIIDSAFILYGCDPFFDTFLKIQDKLIIEKIIANLKILLISKQKDDNLKMELRQKENKLEMTKKNLENQIEKQKLSNGELNVKIKNLEKKIEEKEDEFKNDKFRFIQEREQDKLQISKQNHRIVQLIHDIKKKDQTYSNLNERYLKLINDKVYDKTKANNCESIIQEFLINTQKEKSNINMLFTLDGVKENNFNLNDSTNLFNSSFVNFNNKEGNNSNIISLFNNFIKNFFKKNSEDMINKNKIIEVFKNLLLEINNEMLDLIEIKNKFKKHLKKKVFGDHLKINDSNQNNVDNKTSDINDNFKTLEDFEDADKIKNNFLYNMNIFKSLVMSIEEIKYFEENSDEYFQSFLNFEKKINIKRSQSESFKINIVEINNGFQKYFNQRNEEMKMGSSKDLNKNENSPKNNNIEYDNSNNEYNNLQILSGTHSKISNRIIKNYSNFIEFSCNLNEVIISLLGYFKDSKEIEIFQNNVLNNVNNVKINENKKKFKEKFLNTTIENNQRIELIKNYNLENNSLLTNEIEKMEMNQKVFSEINSNFQDLVYFLNDFSNKQ